MSVFIDNHTQLAGWWWHSWFPRNSPYKPKNHPLHAHFIWYCIENKFKQIDKKGFNDFVTKFYEKDKSRPKNMNEKEFTRLQRCCWYNHPTFKHMLLPLGVLARNKKIDDDDGSNQHYPSCMLCV